MKKIVYSLITILALFFTACQKEDLVFDHENPMFPVKENAILLEVIVPAGTSAKDQVYIVGAFNGMDTLHYENADFVLSKSDMSNAKYGIYLYPEDFVEDYTLADGFLFVSKTSGIENPAVPHTIANAQLGERYTISITRWGGAAVTPQIQHDGYVVYVDDRTSWSNFYMYMWGDVNDLNGVWPGMEVTGTEVVGGITYKYFDLGAANEGLSENLIFNNGDGTQLDNYPIVINRNYYLRVTVDGVEEIEQSAGGEGFPQVEHDGDVVYFVDNADWGAMALYLWGDVNDLVGGWPGMQPTGTFEYKNRTWYYFDLGADNAGKTEHFIINNNGGGTQIDDVLVRELTTDSVFYFIVNADKTVTPFDDPAAIEFEDPVELEPAAIDLYVLDATVHFLDSTLESGVDTTYQMAVYAWGAKECFGGWPGMVIADNFDETDILGIALQHYRIECNLGNEFNLIFNNNGNNKQMPDYNVKAEAGTQSFYLKVTDEGVEPLQAQALKPIR